MSANAHVVRLKETVDQGASAKSSVIFILPALFWLRTRCEFFEAGIIPKRNAD